MSRQIEGARWDKAIEMLRVGHSRSDIRRQTGISEAALRRFLAGDPSSSGRQWFALKRQLAELDTGPRTTASA